MLFGLKNSSSSSLPYPTPYLSQVQLATTFLTAGCLPLSSPTAAYPLLTDAPHHHDTTPFFFFLSTTIKGEIWGFKSQIRPWKL